MDQTTEDGTVSRYFKEKEAAIGYLAGLSGETALRHTTLEDVFLERVGGRLESR